MKLYDPNNGKTTTNLAGGSEYDEFMRQRYNSAPAEQILNTIWYDEDDMIKNNTAGFFMLEKLKELENSGFIRFAGDGSNRRFFEINSDMRGVLNRSGFYDSNVPVVCGIPINIVNGTKDNNREILAPKYIDMVCASANATDESRYLQLVLPKAVAYDDSNYIIMQEKVTPIEQSAIVQELYNSNPEKYKGNVGSAVLDAFYTYPELMAQLDKLMQAMDKYFVMCDLNIIFSRFNFGFKNIGGAEYLTVLDLGGVIPRVVEDLVPKCPHCGTDLHYVNIAEDFFNADKFRRERLYMALTSSGLYSCKSSYCHGEKIDPETVDDIVVFEGYRKNLIRGISSGKINLNGWNELAEAL
jgi:hypothetical protein